MNEVGKEEQEVTLSEDQLWQFSACGNCQFWRQLKTNTGDVIGGTKMGDCFGAPPTPILVPGKPGALGNPGAAQVTLMQPRVPENFPACGTFRLNPHRLPPFLVGANSATN